MSVDRDAVRAAVRRRTVDLQPGDTCQPWNDRAAVRRTVATVLWQGDESRLIVWRDGATTECHPNRVWHREVRLAP